MKSRGTIPTKIFYVIIWAFMVSGAAPGLAAPDPLEQRARDQIALLQQEKSSRTPDQQKLDSQILYSLRQSRLGAVAAGVPLLRPSLQFEKSGLLLVDMNCTVSPGLLQYIKAGGGTVLNSFERYGTIRAECSLALAESISKRNDVRSIRPADQATFNTIALLQGDIAHAADQARAAFVVNGGGVKVGVLSDSVDYLNTVQQNGLLPPVTILPGQSGSGNGEGTAMLEIIHSLAPGSDLYFATAFGGVSSFAQNIRDLYAAGCRIIVDDVLYFNEPAFQDGPIAQAVNDVSAGGALFFSSAGNAGGLNRNTAGCWEGDFKDGGIATIGRGGRLHDFGGVTYNTVVPGGSLQRVDLFWADPMGSSTNDYDVYVLDSNGNVVRSSTNIQNGQSDPYESLNQLNTGERIVIVKQSGDSRFLHLSTLRGRLQFVTSGSTYGHNASGAQNAFSVAATQVSSPPQPFTGGAANPVEGFSSDGPRRIFFNPDGSAITPGNFGSTGGALASKTRHHGG